MSTSYTPTILTYTNPATPLSTITVWRPSTPTPTSGIWFIYIHGGAWRDPLIRPEPSFSPTISHLESTSPSSLQKIAGFASIDYPLSPHPAHPSDAPDRNVVHPAHISSVIAALAYLQSECAVTKYVLIGHSCGATLALQTAMQRTPLNLPSTVPLLSKMPVAVVGLNGLYDLPNLIKRPGKEHERIKGVYEAFTQGAFGSDEAVWSAVSPAFETDWSQLADTDVVVLAQSRQDTLVPYWQTEEMMQILKERSNVKVEEWSVTGDHNQVWQDGRELAGMIERLVEMLV